jgi:hypothetical protein
MAPNHRDAFGVKNRSVTNPERTINPDFGLYLLKTGLAVDESGKKVTQLFIDLPLMTVAKLEDNKYSIHCILISLEGEKLMLTADFNRLKYKELLSVINDESRKNVEAALKMQPFLFHFRTPQDCQVGMSGKIGDVIFTSPDENYCPLGVEKFF